MPVCDELTSEDLDVDVLPQDRVPLEFPDAAPGSLVGSGLLGQVDGLRGPCVPVEAVRLVVPPSLAEGHEFVVSRRAGRDLSSQTPDLRTDWLDGKGHLSRGPLVCADRRVPPEGVSLDRSARIDI